MTSKTFKAEINRMMGRRKKLSKKPEIVAPTPTYPVRHRALGKTKTVKQGVGGWRTNYHRPDTVELAPAKIITITYDDV
jgi:hypothetical protein